MSRLWDGCQAGSVMARWAFVSSPSRAAARQACRTYVRYAGVVTERHRLAQRAPRSLQPEQMGHYSVSTPALPQRVQAWVVWEDGAEERLPAYAIAWTRRAVLVRFGAPPHQHDVWVWAGAVERA